MATRSKNYRNSQEKISGKEFYGIEEAIKLLKETSSVKFDETTEAHFNLNIDPTKADQALRGTLALPHGSGKKLKIAAVVNDNQVKAAKEAGAEVAGLEDLIAEFEKGNCNYDVVVAASDTMRSLSKVAKVLGQKGLMPSPKSGTVTSDVVKTIKELVAGRIEYRNDKQGVVHTIFGKVSFKEAELENNLKAIIKVIKDSKPSAVKGTYIKSISISSSMGPGIFLDVAETIGSF